MAVGFKTIFPGITEFIRASLLWVAIAAVFGFLLGYWISSSTGHWMLVDSSSSTGSTQTVGIFQTKRRCSRFMEWHKEQLKKYLSDEKAKTMNEEDKKFFSSLEREGIIVFGKDLSWVTVSCVRLNDGFLGHMLSAIESTVDNLGRR
jgi:hypothetical protein